MSSLVIDAGRKICHVGIFAFVPTTAEQKQSFSKVYWVQILYLYTIMSLLLTCIIRFNATLNESV